MYDVAVIGAGPSGSYTAYLLAKEKFDVLILDKDDKAKNPVICTGIVSKEAFERFSLPKGSIIRDINSANFISPGGKVFRYQHGSTFAHILDRSVLDSSILEQAIKEGATFYLNSYVEGLCRGKEYVEIYYKQQGKPRSSTAKVAVIASGAGSHLLGKGGLKGPTSYLQGVQAEVDFNELDEVEIYLGDKIAPGSFAWAVPLMDGKARLGITLRDSACSYLKKFLEVPTIKKRLKNGRIKIGCRPVAYGISPKTYSSRILSVGDAAGQVKTTTGGGIYYGLIGAEIAAQTIIEAFDEADYSESHFRMYEKRWRKILEPEIKMGLSLREIYAASPDEKIDYLIDLANRDGIASLIRNKGRFDWQKNLFLSLLKKPIIRKILF